MARRNSSLTELIIGASAKLPWWVSISMAIIAYFGLGLFSDVPIENISNMKDMGRVVTKQMFISFARIFQYVLPFFFVIGAVVSIILNRKKKKLYGHLIKNPKLQTLTETSWSEFELLVGRFFEQQGYTVRQLTQPGPDDGIDLVVIKDGDKYLVLLQSGNDGCSVVVLFHHQAQPAGIGWPLSRGVTPWWSSTAAPLGWICQYQWTVLRYLVRAGHYRRIAPCHWH